MDQTWSNASQRKRIHPDDLKNWSETIKGQGKTIATLNGSFDLLHAGHLEMIYTASQAGDVLIVALNSDASIKAYKSTSRPIIPLELRLSMMSALEFVHFVTWFEETDPCSLLAKIKPNTHVNGAEYGENCIEAETVKKFGGKIQIVPLVPGLSTTDLIQKVKACDF